MVTAVLPYTDEAEATFIHNVVRLSQLASTTVTLYDHLITFDQEVQLVWNKPWSIAKAIFLWIRYFGSLLLFTEAFVFSVKPPSNQFCRVWFIVQAWSTAIIIWSMQYVMLFRTFAMYDHCRKIVIPCSVCFAAEVLLISTFFASSFHKVQSLNQPFPGLYVCTSPGIPYYAYTFWIPIVAFDCMLLVLALCICIRRVQSIPGLYLSRNRIWKVLLVDSLLYFSITVVAYIASGVVWLNLPIRWHKLPPAFSIAWTCLMGTRLILNLRKAYYVSLAPDLSLIIDEASSR